MGMRPISCCQKDMGQCPTKLLPITYGTVSQEAADNKIWDSIPQATANKIWNSIPMQLMPDAASPLALRRAVTAQDLT